MRHGEAPSARRTAISRARPSARTRSRLPTLPQAMSRSTATAPKRTSTAGFASRTRSACSGATNTLQPVLNSGRSAVSWAREAFERALGLGHGHPRLEPGDGEQEPAAALPLQAGAAFDEGRPGFGPGRHLERRRHHPHHAGGLAVQHHVAPEDARVGAEAATPEPVGQDDHVGRALASHPRR